MKYETIKKASEKAAKKPKTGMRFHEMFSAWLYILNVDETGASMVRTFSGHPSNPIAETIRFHRFHTLKELKEKLKYYNYCDDKAFERMKKELWVSSDEINKGRADDSKPLHWKVGTEE